MMEIVGGFYIALEAAVFQLNAWVTDILGHTYSPVVHKTYGAREYA